MVGRISFKQNIGCLGKNIVVCGAHGHYRTMKGEWPTALVSFWDRLAAKIYRHGVQFLAGDFNMAFTTVVTQLRSRGLKIDCVAWYPWRHTTAELHGQHLGFDSCGIFYIGGTVKVSMPWSLRDMETLVEIGNPAPQSRQTLHAVGDLKWMTNAIEDSMLDRYEGTNHPGQPWSAYRWKSFKEAKDEKNLQQQLEELLQPTSNMRDLDNMPKRPGSNYRPYLRLKSKTMDKREWLGSMEAGSVGQIHNGAHFPLCVFTDNGRARSKEKTMERAQKREKAKRVHEPAVAENTYVGNPTGAWSSSSSWWSARPWWSNQDDRSRGDV
jgi:hypothetical protein